MHRNGWARSIEDKDSTFSQSFDVSQTAAHRCSPSPVCECVWSAPMAAKLGGTEKGALLKLLSPVTKEQDAATRLRRSCHLSAKGGEHPGQRNSMKFPLSNF